MKRKTVILSAIVTTAVIGVGWAAGVGLASAPPIKSDPRQGPQLVKVVTAKPSTGATRAFTGVISARVQSNLGFRVPGKVIERFVDVGQTVRAGDPLMGLDQTDLDLGRTAKENAVVAARAAAEQAAAAFANSRRFKLGLTSMEE